MVSGGGGGGGGGEGGERLASFPHPPSFLSLAVQKSEKNMVSFLM